MDNMLTIALVVLICSIVVMFSAEFGDFFKKIFSIPGMKLFLPLIFVTILVGYYEPWLLIGLIEVQRILVEVSEKLASWLPFQTGAVSTARVLLLMLLSLLPVFVLNLWLKRRTFHGFQYSYLTTTLIWLLVSVLLSTHIPSYGV